MIDVLPKGMYNSNFDLALGLIVGFNENGTITLIVTITIKMWSKLYLLPCTIENKMKRLYTA
jgi:hypothetical protein